MSVARPGWYPDPRATGDPAEREVRWFDGEAWTSWLAPAGTTAPPVQEPLARVVPDDVRADRQWHRLGRALGWLALVLLVLAVSGVISQRRVPSVTFPTPRAPVTAAPTLDYPDVALDQNSGYGRIGAVVAFRMPTTAFKLVRKDAMLPESFANTSITASTSGTVEGFPKDSSATLGLVNADILTPDGYRTITPSLLRLIVGNTWTGATVGELTSRDVTLREGHPGVEVSGPVTHDGRTDQVSLLVAQANDSQWIAWWEVRTPSLTSAQAKDLDRARAALGFLA